MKNTSRKIVSIFLIVFILMSNFSSIISYAHKAVYMNTLIDVQTMRYIVTVEDDNPGFLDMEKNHKEKVSEGLFSEKFLGGDIDPLHNLTLGGDIHLEEKAGATAWEGGDEKEGKPFTFPAKEEKGMGKKKNNEIGRASCRERV